MKSFSDESVDLVYIDPPFNTGRVQKNKDMEYDDRWPHMEAYIGWMRNRVNELHRVLKPTGSIYLYCDWRTSHRLRCLLDDVFGVKNFRNEIIWCYKSGGASQKSFSKKHDNIYWYSKSDKWVYNCQRIKSYKKGGRNPSETLYRDELGLYGMVNQRSWWEISFLSTSQKERLGYPTQKPLALLERIIKASSNEGDIVLDAFCGSGTTLHAAQKLNRKWIGIDSNPQAIKICKQRLKVNHG